MSGVGPLYENVEQDIEHVKHIDDRVIQFLYVVKQAPCDIQRVTDKFLASIDKLKKNYVLNIVKSKRIERKHTDALRYVSLCQREYDFFRRQDDYLSQVSSEEHYAVDEKLEQAKLELAMCYCQLQLAVRELELSKEKLSRLSKRAEHLFLSTLRNHPEGGWAHIYKNESQRTKSELYRASSNPPVAPKPLPRVRCDHSTRERRRNEPVNYNTRRPNNDQIDGKNSTPGVKRLTKSQSLDGDVNSSDDEFPPPPPPLSLLEMNVHQKVVVVDVIDRSRKRFSERSAVDEGIGDIDWKPSMEDVSGLYGTVRTIDRLTKIIDDVDSLSVEKILINETDHATSNITKLYEEKLTTSETSSSIYSTAVLDNICADPPEPALNAETDSISPIISTVNSNKISPVHEVSVDTETTIPSVPFLESDTVDGNMPANDNANEQNTSHDTNVLHNAHDVLNDKHKDDVTSHVKDSKLTHVQSDSQHIQKDDRRIHVYEDVPYLPTHKKKAEKKKSKLKFITKMFHGPWEGWES